MDVRARTVNEEMMLAATRALAELAQEDVPESVRTAYAGETIRYGRDYLIPKPFDPRVLYYVAPAVARAAMESGVARVQLDLNEYRDRLRASLGPGREVMRWMSHRARQKPARVVIPEGHNEKVIRAAAAMVEEGVARPVLMGRPDVVREKAAAMGVDLDGVCVKWAVEEEETRERYAQELYRRRARKGLTLNEARQDMLKPLPFAMQMVREGDADAVLAGIESNYPEVVRPALQVIGVASGVDHVAGLYMLAFPNRELLFFADTTVNIDPDASTLADIALLSARFVRDLGIQPRVAMVSFSNFGSAHHPEAQKVAAAVQLIRRRDPYLTVDGEMQADTAVDMQMLQEVYDFSTLKEPANVLVFSNLTAANVAYKLLDRLGGAEVIGPVLLGMSCPIHILQRGSTGQDVLNLATIASVDAQTRSPQN
jgi:malate dehydrogenase (oxaloacetate-decarboxylating)(NADP+)